MAKMPDTGSYNNDAMSLLESGQDDAPVPNSPASPAGSPGSASFDTITIRAMENGFSVDVMPRAVSGDPNAPGPKMKSFIAKSSEEVASVLEPFLGGGEEEPQPEEEGAPMDMDEGSMPSDGDDEMGGDSGLSAPVPAAPLGRRR